jgi:TolB protein
VAYAVRARSGRVELHERDLASGTDRTISSRAEISFTPSYSPDGKRLVFAFSTGLGMEIHEYDVEKRCCLRRVTNGPRMDLAPSFSGDGRRIAFQSDRLGQPHIFVTSIDGGQATMLTPYGASGVKYNAPDWSPTGNEIVFSGESRGGFHLMIADATRPGTADQITETGNNEDPSWAPDGRHIVFTGVGSEGRGLYVIDRVSLRRRILVSGARLRMPEWSAHLAGSVATGNGN